MITVLTILMLIACVLLVLFVLVQNPKGGGLNATFGGVNNQILGVQKTTDFLEKGTWWLAGIFLVLCLSSNFFVRSTKGDAKGAAKSEVIDALPKSAQPGTK